MIRTMKFALRSDPANIRAIGYHATQQNAAYNVAVSEQLERIAQADAKDEPLKHRNPRPRRRTLAHCSRKTSRLSLTITDQQMFQISDAGHAAGRQCRSILRLRGKQTLQRLDTRFIRLVSAADHGPRTPLERRHYCPPAQVWEPDPTMPEQVVIPDPEDILGADRGRKNHAVFSTSRRVHLQGAKQQSRQHRKHQRYLAGKPRNSKRRRQAAARNGTIVCRYATRRDQDPRRQVRNILLAAQPKMVAMESLRPVSKMASARTAAGNPGQHIAAKRKLNEILTEAAIGHGGKLLSAEAATLGIPTVTVLPQGPSQTCPRCGHRHRDNHESQAVFRCRQCGRSAHAAWTANVILHDRTFVRHCAGRCGTTPSVEEAPTGWREPPSGSAWQPWLLLPEQSVFKSKGSAASPLKRRGPWPKAGPPYSKRVSQTHEVSSEESARETYWEPLLPAAGSPLSGHTAQFVNTL